MSFERHALNVLPLKNILLKQTRFFQMMINKHHSYLMKIIQSILIYVCFNLIGMENASGQVKNYEAQWKKIDELVQKKQLPKSALEEVKKIYTQAKTEKQDAQ